jgi:hypothetical protein
MVSMRSAWICILLCSIWYTAPASAAGYAGGRVMEYPTQRPIAGAIITGNSETVRTDNNGRFL